MSAEEIFQKAGGFAAISSALKFLTSLFSKKDKNADIKKSIEDLASMMNNRINEIDASLKTLAGKIDKFESDKEAKKELEIFRGRVNQIAAATLTSYKLNSTMQSMILSGAEMVGKVFSEIISAGIDHLDVAMVRIRCISALKTIRANHEVNTTSREFSEKLKAEIAYPLLEALSRDLLEVKNGSYEGLANTKIKEIAFTFTKSFIDDSIKLYRECSH